MFLGKMLYFINLHNCAFIIHFFNCSLKTVNFEFFSICIPWVFKNLFVSKLIFLESLSTSRTITSIELSTDVNSDGCLIFFVQERSEMWIKPSTPSSISTKFKIGKISNLYFKFGTNWIIFVNFTPGSEAFVWFLKTFFFLLYLM